MGKFEAKEPSIGTAKVATSPNLEQAAAAGRIRRLRELYGKFVHLRPRGYRRFDSMEQMRQAKAGQNQGEKLDQVKKPPPEAKAKPEVHSGTPRPPRSEASQQVVVPESKTSPEGAPPKVAERVSNNTSSPEVPPGSPGETIVDTTKKTPETVSERERGLQLYRKALAACFDENGKFAIRYGPPERHLGMDGWRREVWNGREIAKHLLDGPEAEGIWEVMSGERPIVFLNFGDFYSASRDASPQTLQKFFEEQGINLRFYAHKVNKRGWVNENLILYNPAAVKNVVKENRDVFADWDENESVEDNLKNGLRWEIFRQELWKYKDPTDVFKGVSAAYKGDEVGTAKILFNPIVTPLQFALYGERVTDTLEWSPQIAQTQAMKTGLLMGFPREVLEDGIEDRMYRAKLDLRLTSRHDFRLPVDNFNARLAESIRKSGFGGVRAEFLRKYEHAKIDRLGKALGKITGRSY